MLPERWKAALQNINPLKPVPPETAFYPPALEIMETPVSPLARAVSLTIIAFLAIALLWAGFGSVDIVVSAPGRIVPSGRAKLIQPFETGVIRAIHVTDGQQVKAGEILIEIDPTINAADTARLTAQLLDKKLEVARLRAASLFTGDPAAAFIPPAGAASEQIELQKSALISETRKIAATLGALDGQIAQDQAIHDVIAASIAKIEKALPYLRKRSSIYGYLNKKGYGSKLQSLQSKQQVIEYQQELHVQKERLNAASAAAAKAKQKRAEAEAGYRATVLTDLAKAQQEAATLAEQLVQAEKRYQLQSLKAPVNGTVQQLAVHTEGGVVTPAQTLLVVVPQEGGLEVEATVANKDVGFIHKGQPVAVKVDTFNFTKYGVLNGTVQVVSSDAIINSGPAAKASPQDDARFAQPVYLARIALQEDHMDIGGAPADLSPGMSVIAEIRTGTRTIMEYLLSPLQTHIRNSLHER